MNVNEAIKCAMDGNAVLFLGAGFSFGGINVTGNEILTGSGLSRKLCNEMAIAQSDDLTITSARYIDDPKHGKGINELIRLLKSELTCTDTLEIQESIVDLPWIRIYTTNYDNIVEKATEKVGRIRESITAASTRYVSGKYLEEAIIHINGTIDNLCEEKFVEEFKITDDNYVKDGFLESPWSDLFQTDLEKAKVIVFIGYSLDYDQDIKKMLARLRIAYKCIFIDVSSVSENVEYRLNKYGSLYKIGATGFAEEIVKIKSTYVPHVKLIQLSGFQQVDSEDYYSDEQHTSRQVIDLIIKGKFERKYINQDGYCIKREKSVEKAIQLLDANKIIIVRSKLGNGKTIFIESLANSLCSNSNVYFVNNLDTMYDDLQLVLDNSGKENILIIDDYGYYIKLLKELVKDFPSNLKLILTCRSAININLYYDLTNKYGYQEEEIAVLDIDLLLDSDVREVVLLLDINRLWGSYDKLSYSQKKKLINKKYHSNISNIFYLLLNSEQISKEVNGVLNETFKKEGLKSFVFAQAINSICNLKLKFYDICKFINISTALLEKYSLNLEVNEIINFNNGKMEFTSSIFSQYIIRQGDFSNDIMEILEKIYVESGKGDFSNKYRNQRKMLISRSNIILIFSTNGNVTELDETNIFKYFDSIKNTITASENPFFWLQFGITALNLKEYELASIYFENAYANVRLLDNFDAYQLDTHKARLILNKELDTNRTIKESAITSFKEAHRLLINNSNTGKNLKYILKQTGTYFKYFNTYSVLFNNEEKEEFIKKSFEIKIKYQSYFNIAEIKIIPHEVAVSYLNYRKLFNKSIYSIEVNKLDNYYNLKINDKRYKAYPLEII